MPRRIPSDVVQLLRARASIHGLDINPNCKEVERNGVCIHIGDQTDCEFLSQVVEKMGTPDIIIDDGGHSTKQQQISCSYLFEVGRRWSILMRRLAYLLLAEGLWRGVQKKGKFHRVPQALDRQDACFSFTKLFAYLGFHDGEY